MVRMSRQVRLQRTWLQVPWERFKVVQLRAPTLVEGVTVTFLDANHCPGAHRLLPIWSATCFDSKCQRIPGSCFGRGCCVLCRGLSALVQDWAVELLSVACRCCNDPV